MVFPDFRLLPPPDPGPFIETHARAFPAEAKGIEAFVKLGMQVTQEAQRLSPRLALRDLDEAARQFPTLFRYRMASLEEVLDAHVGDHRARAALTACWPYHGVPPSRVSFVGFCAILIGMLDQGLVYCRGSFQRLADAFAGAVEDSGGEFFFGREVTAISVSDGRAAGVVLDDGTPLAADEVVSNADARLTLLRLVGAEHLPDRYVRSLERMTPSLSAFVLYLATTLDVTAHDVGHEAFTFRHWDHDATYADILDGRVGGMWVSLPTVVDQSLAPEGEHLVIASTLAPYDVGEPWEDGAKERYTEEMLAEVEALLPGVRAALTFSEAATPKTFERYTLNYRGAIYGWDHIPSQTMPKRLSRHTPVEGLWLAGHWTEPGGTSFRVIYSGFQTAQLMLGHDDPGDLLSRLEQGAPQPKDASAP